MTRESTNHVGGALRPALLALTLAAGYYGGTRLGLALRFPGTTLAPIWPPNALLLAALLLSSPRRWWLWCLAILPAHLAAHAGLGLPPWRLALQLLHNLALCLPLAVALRRAYGGPPRLDSVHEVASFLVASAVASLAAALMLGAVYLGVGVWATLLPQLGLLSLSNMLTCVTLAPAVVLAGARGGAWLGSATCGRAGEVAAFVAALLVAGALYGAQEPGPASAPVLLYGPLPLLLWAAARFGPGGFSLTSAAITLLALWHTAAGRGPFLNASVAENSFNLQTYFLAFAMPLLLVAALMDERRRAAADLARLNAGLGARVAARTAERRRVEATLRERELLLRSVSDNLPSGYIYQLEYAPGGALRYLYVSAGVGSAGVTPEQAYADPEAILGQLLPEDRRRLGQLMAAFSADATVFEFEGRVRRPGGAMRWIYARSTPHRFEDGRLLFSGIALDITARKQAEEALRRRVDELEALNAVARGLNGWTEISGGLAAVGPTLRALFDAAAVTVWDRDPAEGTLRLLIRVDAGGAWPGGGKVVTPRGAALTAGPVRVLELAPDDPLLGGAAAGPAQGAHSALLVPLRAHGEPVGLLCIGAPAARAYSAAEIALAQTIGGMLASALENARLFLQAQFAAAERERRRLAQELHDSVSQALYGANRAAETIPVIWELDPDEGRERLRDLQRFTQSALAEMRTLLVELRPRALVERPLHKTLGLLAEALAARDGLSVEVGLEPVPLLLPDVQVMLYRIAQEALMNVSKHARARHVSLLLTPSPLPEEGRPWAGTITMRIADNGRGFRSDEVEAGRMGLQLLYERASEIGAELELSSELGRGTLLNVTWRGAAAAAD